MSPSSTLGFAFTGASFRHAPVLVVHSAPLSEVTVGEQGTRLNLAQILVGWKADYPDIDVETSLLAGPPRDTVASGAVQPRGTATTGCRDMLATVLAVCPSGMCPLSAR